jgi:tetratricopeptide (TPR) repeat protein
MYSSKQHPALIEAEEPADASPDSEGTTPEDQAPAAQPSEEQPEVSLELQKVEASQLPVGIPEDPTAGIHRKSTARLWVTAAGFAVMLAVLTIAGIYLITKKPSTVDQLVIQTFPSGADITLDSKDYGHSPVKLEKVPIGRYTLTITKEGYDPIVDQVDVTEESQPLVYKLKPAPFANGKTLSPEEQMKLFQQSATDAFSIGHYAIPLDSSALYYAEAMLGIDQSNQFAIEMRERVRKVLHQRAQTETARGDLGRAQDIYQVLVDFYPEDEDAKSAAARLENQLASKKGEVRDLLAKAQEAFDAGRLVEPDRASAYYYSRQALARDRQNAQARAILDSVKATVSAETDQSYSQDPDRAIKQLERVTNLFPEDQTARAKLRAWTTRRTEEVKIANDPKMHRTRGLERAAAGEFARAIPDLEFAMTNDQGTADVVAALARSHHQLGNLDQAVNYYRMVPQAAGEAYRTAIAAMGDIAMGRMDSATALARYKQALQLGGSTVYSVEVLQEKIDKIERRIAQKEAEPAPLTIHVTHLHGKFQGSCDGNLSVSSTGVRYEGRGDHTFSSNLAGMRALASGEKLTLMFSKKSDFKCSSGDSDRFREALARYQTSSAR